MVPKAPLEATEHGVAANGEGWFVVNAREAPWWYREGRGAYCELEGKPGFEQLGISVVMLGPGEAMAMYHWQADQEDFLLISGEALLIIEGEERPMRAWDFVHCPPGTKHVIIGAGDGPCVVIAIGARQHQDGPDWGGYTVDEVALRHGAGVEEETNDPKQVYAGISRELTRYREGWLPD